MSALNCLSCEHENPPGAKFCQECGSALNLKLCKQCEAINAVAAEQCHKCQAPFAAAVEKVDAPAPAKQRLRVNAVSASVGALVGLAVLGAVGYHFAQRQQPRPAQARSGPVVEKAITPVAAPAPIEKVAVPAPVPVQKVSAPVAPPVERKAERKAVAAPAPVAPRPATHTAVTHTRGAAAPAPARPAPAPAPRVVPVEKAPVEVPPQIQRGADAPRVTHTKGATTAEQPVAGKTAQPPIITTETKRESN